MLFVLDFPGEFITINFIHTKGDLSESKFFVVVSSNHQSVYEKLEIKAAQYRQELSSKLYLRRMPKLIFVRDEMGDDIDRVERLLNKNQI